MRHHLLFALFALFALASAPAESAAEVDTLLARYTVSPNMQGDPVTHYLLFRSGRCISELHGAGREPSGAIVTKLGPSTISRIANAVDRLKGQATGGRRGAHDAQTTTYAAWRSDGSRILIHNSNGAAHPDGQFVKATLDACIALDRAAR